MIAVMIFAPKREPTSDDIINNYHLAMLLAKRHFNEVHLVGNNIGIETLNKLPWSSTSNQLEFLDEEFKYLSGYERIAGLDYFSRIFDSFIYINNDCFLWEKPNEDTIASNNFFLCNSFIDPEIKKLLFNNTEDALQIDKDLTICPNIDLCGKNNSNIFTEYFDYIHNLFTSIRSENQENWNVLFPKLAPKYPIIENYLFGQFLTSKGIVPSYIFPNDKSPNATFCQITSKDAEVNGFTKLGTLKSDIAIQNSIKQRLAQKPPNLEMKKNAGMIKSAVNFAKAMTIYAIDGFKNAAEVEYKKRLSICSTCEYWSQEKFNGLGKCEKCGCSGAKLWIASSKCPLNKWEIDTEVKV